VTRSWKQGAALAIGATVVGALIALLFFAAAVEASFQERVSWSPTRLLARTSVKAGEPTEWITIAEEPDREGRLRKWVELRELPEFLVDTVMLIEDRRFFDHHGIDLRRVVGAALANLRAGRVVQGGSTITQQLARSVHLPPDRTFSRKFAEALGALVLEWRHEKEVLLEAYLNEIYLAQDGLTAIHGVALASLHTFRKPVEKLTLSETALLAGLIRAPSVYSPLRNPEAARRRRDQVLKILLDAGRVSETSFRQAAAEPIEIRRPGALRGPAPHLLTRVRNELVQELGMDVVARGGLSVATTLDVALQRAALRAVRNGLSQLEASYPELRSGEAPLEAALVVLDPRSGEVRAFVGSRDYRRSQFDHVASARRQPGSAFKPVVALAALARRGDEPPAFTLASLLEDEPLRIELDGRAWEPLNHDGRFRGRVTLREAIEQSLNVPVARMGLELGLERIIEAARRLGIESRMEPWPSLPLGAFELTLLELTRAYAVLAAGGLRAPLHSVLAVRDAEGAEIPIPREDPERVFAAAETYLVTSALQGAVDRGSGAPLRALGFLGAVAGKTGTTDGYRDAWFVTYTPELAVGVWVGFDDGRSLGRAASELALPIAARFLRTAVGTRKGVRFRPPNGIVKAAVELQKEDYCVRTSELFLVGSAPREHCADAESSDLP